MPMTQVCNLYVKSIALRTNQIYESQIYNKIDSETNDN